MVVPLDGSPLAEEALPAATSLAQRLHVPVHLVTAIDATRILPVEIMPTGAFDASVYEETVAQLKAGATAWLTQAAEQLQHEGVTTTWSILHGSSFPAIADAVKPGDVIVMTSHSRGGAKRWLLGSVAEKLIREGRFQSSSFPRRNAANNDAPVADAARLPLPFWRRFGCRDQCTTREFSMFDRILIPRDSSDHTSALSLPPVFRMSKSRCF